MLQSLGWQRVGHDLETQQQQEAMNKSDRKDSAFPTPCPFLCPEDLQHYKPLVLISE